MLLSVTPSLYNAYYWYKALERSSEEEFLKVLRKEPSPTTPEIQAGIDFENSVHEVCRTCDPIGDDAIDFVADLVRGGEWQKPCAGRLEEWVLSGRMDVYFPFIIYDIKKISKNYDLGQYRHSIQHLVYMYCTEVPQFEYLVCDKSNRVSRECYDWSEDGENILRDRLFEMTEFLFSVPEFKKAYTDNWTVKKNP